MEYLERDNESSKAEESWLIGMLVLAVQPKVAVETGTHTGCTTHHIAEALKGNKGHLWTYDIKDIGEENTESVRFVLGDSSVVKMPKNIGFVFIDACHETDFVIKEFKHIKKNLKKGAVVVFHDYIPTDPGYVAEAIRQLKLKVTYIPTYYGMGIWYNE
jgi:predicted O-methyltransferase YrrM